MVGYFEKFVIYESKRFHYNFNWPKYISFIILIDL